MIRILKVLLGIGLCLILYNQLWKEDRALPVFNPNTFVYFPFILAVILVPVNWFLESLKWQILLKPLISLHWYKSLQSILTGVFIGVFTPARIGEYGGRMVFLPEKYRVPSIVATLYGSIIQNGFHVIFGFTFSYLFIKNLVPETQVTFSLFVTVVSLFCVGFLMVLFLPSYWQFFIPWISKFKLTSFFRKFAFLKDISTKNAFKVFLLSGIRYFVYFFQYICILWSFGVGLPLLTLGSGVSFIYLIQSGLPLPPLLNLLGRGEISVLVWDQFGISSDIAILATLTLWFINVLLPALTGYVFFIKNKSLEISLK